MGNSQSSPKRTHKGQTPYYDSFFGTRSQMHNDYLTNFPYDRQIIYDYKVAGTQGLKDQVEGVKEFLNMGKSSEEALRQKPNMNFLRAGSPSEGVEQYKGGK
jgi:hypothetical protein